MKILHAITLAELGGSQSVLIDLVRKSLEDGHEVMVISSKGEAFWKNLPPGVKIQVIPTLQRAIHPVKDARVIYELIKINKKFKPDIIHLHSSKMGFLGRLAFPAKKIIYTVHGFDSIRVAFRKFLPLEKILQYRVQHIVAVSKYDHDNLLSEGVKRNVSFIYNGISDYSIDSEKRSDVKFLQARAAMEGRGKFNILSIARLAAPKRFDLFCEIATELKEHDINFFWIGNRQVVKGIPENVYCLGEIVNAHQLLPYTNIFLLTSDYEGMPVSILEALCYGIPVMASNVGGIPEVLDGKNGIALNNVAKVFVDHILNYKNDQSFYQQTTAQARKSYERNFTVSKMYQAYIKLYQSIIK